MYMLTDISLASCFSQVWLMLTGIFPPPLGADCVSTVLPLYMCASPEDSIQASGICLISWIVCLGTSGACEVDHRLILGWFPDFPFTLGISRWNDVHIESNQGTNLTYADKFLTQSFDLSEYKRSSICFISNCRFFFIPWCHIGKLRVLAFWTYVWMHIKGTNENSTRTSDDTNSCCRCFLLNSIVYINEPITTLA